MCTAGEPVTTPQDALEHARRALDEAIRSHPDDFEHLGDETRDAYVDGTLSGVDREIAEAHLALCPLCAEDIQDLEAVRRDLTAATPARRPVRWTGRAVAVAGSLAAGLALAVWLGRPPAPDQVQAPPPAGAVAVQPQAPRPAPMEVLDAGERAAVDRVLGGGALAVPDEVQRLTGSAGVLLGRQAPASTFAPTAPRGSVLVTARPEFQWTAREGATAYSVAVYNDQFNEVMASPRITGTRWLPSSDLPRGASYQWQVTAHTASGDVTSPVPPQPEARFRVADSATAADITRLQQRLKDKPLDLGILLAERGFIADAIAALDRAAAVPATAEQANRLKAELAAR